MSETTTSTMTEADMRELLTDYLLDGEDGAIVHTVESFTEAMVLTINEGMVIRMEDGSEFQVTIVKSRCAR